MSAEYPVTDGTKDLCPYCNGELNLKHWHNTEAAAVVRRAAEMVALKAVVQTIEDVDPEECLAWAKSRLRHLEEEAQSRLRHLEEDAP